MALELLEQDGGAFLATLAVTNGVVDLDVVQHGAVVQGDLESVTNVALVGGVVLGAEALVLNTLHLVTESVDAGVSGDLVCVVVSGQTAVDKGNGNHVLNAVVTVGVVVERTLLVDDAKSGLLGADTDVLDVVSGLAKVLELLVQSHGSLSSGLSVELSRERDLEQNVLHDVGAVRALELELVALEQDVVEAPGGGSENGGHATLAALDEQSHVDGTGAGVTGSPRLAAHGVGSVTVGTQALAVNPGLGDGVSGLLAVETKHLGHNGGGRDLDQHNVVETNAVEGVLQRNAALDLVGLDHALEHVLDLEDLALLAVGGLGEAGLPVGNSQNGTQVVTGVAPLSSQPAVVEIQPTNDGADGKRTPNGVENVLSTGNTHTIGHGSVRNYGLDDGVGLRVLEGLEAAAESVKQAETGSLLGDFRVDLVVVNVVGDVLDLLVDRRSGVISINGR